MPSAQDDPVAAWETVQATISETLADPDLAGREVATPFSTQSLAETVDMIVTGDVFTHTWDLARATGQDDTLDPDQLRRMVRRRVVAATPARVYAALVDPDALVEWLPPSGSTGTFERFDPRPGGTYRLVLTFDPASGAQGKATADTDVVEATFVELVPDRRVVQRIEFESDDPAFAGTMTMTWQVTPTEGGTLVELVAENVPPGISAEDHATGLASSLDNLAAFVAR